MGEACVLGIYITLALWFWFSGRLLVMLWFWRFIFIFLAELGLGAARLDGVLVLLLFDFQASRLFLALTNASYIIAIDRLSCFLAQHTLFIVPEL
jgi:hypothetical protein